MTDNTTVPNGGKSTMNGDLTPNTAAGTTWTPETVIATLDYRPAESTKSPTSFFHLLERLKTTKRAGWQRFNIKAGESISDHMYRMSIITMLAPPSLSSKLDISRCTRMALIHDMAESLVGDITPVDGVTKVEKNRREAETMDYICNTLLGKVGAGIAGADIRKIWQEYEDNETPEARFVHDVDKMELILQMVEYERTFKDEHGRRGTNDLGEFTWVSMKIEMPEVREWCKQVLQERVCFWKEIGKEPMWPEGVKEAYGLE